VEIAKWYIAVLRIRHLPTLQILPLFDLVGKTLAPGDKSVAKNAHVDFLQEMRNTVGDFMQPLTFEAQNKGFINFNRGSCGI
jgi:hypothetical protein